MSKTIQTLVVDDCEDVHFLVQKNILNTFQTIVTVSKSGQDAVRLLNNGQPFDLIICDFQMPNGDGKMVFDYVQSMSSPIPFILHTSSINLPDFKGREFLGVATKGDRQMIIQLIKDRFYKQLAFKKWSPVDSRAMSRHIHQGFINNVI